MICRYLHLPTLIPCENREYKNREYKNREPKTANQKPRNKNRESKTAKQKPRKTKTASGINREVLKPRMTLDLAYYATYIIQYVSSYVCHHAYRFKNFILF